MTIRGLTVATPLSWTVRVPLLGNLYLSYFIHSLDPAEVRRIYWSGLEIVPEGITTFWAAKADTTWAGETCKALSLLAIISTSIS